MRRRSSGRESVSRKDSDTDKLVDSPPLSAYRSADCRRRPDSRSVPSRSFDGASGRHARGNGSGFSQPLSPLMPCKLELARTVECRVIIALGVSVQQPPAQPVGQPFRRLRWFLLGGALVVGIGVGAAIAVLRSSTAPAFVVSGPPAAPDVTWPAGKKVAPAFSLHNQDGGSISLRQFRGRPVILTFIDPLCRNLCPLEAKTLGRVADSFPASQRPAIVAVSVNHWADARKNLLLDKSKWSLPSDWQWAVGAPAALARVWKDYAIGVSVATKTIAGIKVRRITHTEAAYLVDPRGYQRALYLYPFRASDVEHTIRSLTRA